MKVLGNILWILLGGALIALGWFVMGVLLCITIIGIPFGVQCFKLAGLTLAPYGKSVELNFSKHPIANVLWAMFIGWEMTICYLVAGILSCITIIGIPRGIQAFKIMKLAFFPFGAEVVRK